MKSNNLDIVKCCELCEMASPITETEYMLCSKRGAVDKSHVCKRFTFDPLKLTPRPRPKIYTPEPEQMTLEL